MCIFHKTFFFLKKFIGRMLFWQSRWIYLGNCQKSFAQCRKMLEDRIFSEKEISPKNLPETGKKRFWEPRWKLWPGLKMSRNRIKKINFSEKEQFASKHSFGQVECSFCNWGKKNSDTKPKSWGSLPKNAHWIFANKLFLSESSYTDTQNGFDKGARKIPMQGQTWFAIIRLWWKNRPYIFLKK